MDLRSDDQPITLLTMSFARDFDLCKLLCVTVDDMVPFSIEHIVAVPSADISQFQTLRNARRMIIAEEELMPKWLTKISPPNNWLASRIRLPRRNFYFSKRGLPVRGWIAQQLMKLNAASHVRTETLIHVDSDVAFVRPFERKSFFLNGKTPLLRFPMDANTPMQRPWHRTAARAFGLPARDYFGSGFISNCVPWRKSVVKAMMDHISDRTGIDAIVFLSRTQHFSEYILYGVFCEFVLGVERSGHYATDQQICKTLWTLGTDDVSAVDLKFQQFGNEVAVGVQSTIPLPIENRYALVERLRREMAV